MAASMSNAPDLLWDDQSEEFCLPTKTAKSFVFSAWDMAPRDGEAPKFTRVRFCDIHYPLWYPLTPRMDIQYSHITSVVFSLLVDWGNLMLHEMPILTISNSGWLAKCITSCGLRLWEPSVIAVFMKELNNLPWYSKFEVNNIDVTAAFGSLVRGVRALSLLQYIFSIWCIS
jgi:hypothetical protein